MKESIRDRVLKATEEERRQMQPPVQSDGPCSEGPFSSGDIVRALEANEDGDSWLYIHLNRDHFLFDHADKLYYKWADHFWIPDHIAEATAAIADVIAVYASEAQRQSWLRLKATKEGNSDGERVHQRLEEELLKRIKVLQTLHRKRNVLELATAGSDSLGFDGSGWDSNPDVLPTVNGVVDLETGRIRPGRQEDYFKTVCPTEFLELKKRAPTWEAFLKDVFNGDEALIAYIQRLLGYAITGRTDEHVLPIAWGQGRNGKGTLFETLAHVLGPLAGPIKAEMLLDQGYVRSSGAPDSDTMNLRGKRLVWASETDEGRRLSAGRVKWLTGGDSLTGRNPYGRREISFTPSHTLFLLTNHRPKVDPGDFAIWQRIHLLPFNLSFVDDPQAANERPRDPMLPAKLRAETPGILAWLVRGCLEWRKHGLMPPETVKAATVRYRENEDLVGQFITECCITDRHVTVRAGLLRQAYETWCSENGYRPASGNKFSEYLLKLFDRDDSGRHRSYIGISLRQEEGVGS